MTRLMYDSTKAADIPADATMVAGYIDGVNPWSTADWARFPTAVKVRIARNSLTDDGDVLDVETGDAIPTWVPGWLRLRRAHGLTPVVYVNRANQGAVLSACIAAGVAPPLCWLSTLDGSKPWAAGVVAIQYAGQAITGQHYDLSEVSDQWPGLPRTLRRMVILRAPDGAEYLLSGSLLAGINDAADAQALIAAGIPVASIDQPFLDSVKAAAAALAGGGKLTVPISGSLTIG